MKWRVSLHGHCRMRLKNDPRHYRLRLEEELSDFNNFRYKYSGHNWPSDVDSISHLTQRLLLHYLVQSSSGHWLSETHGNNTADSSISIFTHTHTHKHTRQWLTNLEMGSVAVRHKTQRSTYDLSCFRIKILFTAPDNNHNFILSFLRDHHLVNG